MAHKRRTPLLSISQFTVRLNALERADLNRIADAAGLLPSNLLRAWIARAAAELDDAGPDGLELALVAGGD